MIINSEKPYLKEISSLNVDEIIEALEKDGAIYFPNFFSSETVENIESDFEIAESELLNNNNCGLVFYNIVPQQIKTTI